MMTSGTFLGPYAVTWEEEYMPAVTLRQRGKLAITRGALGQSLRRLSTAGAFLGSAAGLLSTLGTAGCDSDQYVLFNIQNLPGSGTLSVRTSYDLDTSPDKKGMLWLTPPLEQFAIMFPGDTRGDLTATVQAYSFVSPTQCYQSVAVDSSKLSGAHKQERTINMPSQSPVACDPTHIATTFPPTEVAPLVTWGNAPNNIWVAGAEGAVLHWDGNSFAPVPLPADLTANPPTWRAVTGPTTGANQVWLAGDRGVIARWDGTKLTTVKLLDMGNNPSTLAGDALPSWVSASVADAGEEDVFFVSSNGLIGHNRKPATGVQIYSDVKAYPVYPIQPLPLPPPVAISKTISFRSVHCIATDECWIVGYDPKAFASSGQSGAATILQVYTQNVFSDYSMSDTAPQNPVTRSHLSGVLGTFAGPTPRRRYVYAVGENATAVSSDNSVVSAFGDPNFYPRFKTDYSAPAATALAGRSQKINAIGGTSLTDLWVVGEGGILMKWEPQKAVTATPFSLSNTGSAANLTSVFSTTGKDARVYVAGDRQTFFAQP